MQAQRTKHVRTRALQAEQEICRRLCLAPHKVLARIHVLSRFAGEQLCISKRDTPLWSLRTFILVVAQELALDAKVPASHIFSLSVEGHHEASKTDAPTLPRCVAWIALY